MFRRRLWQVLWSKTLPALTVGFPPALSGKRFLLYAVCIVTLTGRFCNGFLSKQPLKF